MLEGKGIMSIHSRILSKDYKKDHSDYRKVLLDPDKKMIEGANVFSVILLSYSEK